MRTTLPVLILTAFATSVFAIEQITATESAATAAAECTSCEKGCSCEKSCCQQCESATASNSASINAVTATVVSTTATTGSCSGQCGGCSECPCAKQNSATAGIPPTAATWTAASTGFAAIIADETTGTAECCSGNSQCTAACEAGCTGSCTSACCAASKQADCESYRIQPSDVLTVIIPALAPKSDEIRQELAAKGITFEEPSGEGDFTVQPDGCIATEAGSVKVDGLTADQARFAIMKKIFEAKPESRRAAFTVFVNVSAKNGQQAYIVLKGHDGCDNVWQIPATEEATVRNAISKTAWPHPIDFAAARIWISRRGTEGQETLLPVAWDAVAGQSTCDTNHAVLPGDRLFVKVSAEQTLPVPPPPIAVSEFPVMPHPIRYYAPSPAAAPSPYTPIAVDMTVAPPVMRYSAIPAAAPSPFAPHPSVFQASPAFAVLPPLPQPPAPTQLQSVPSTQAPCNVESWERDGKNVEFAIEVIEDVSGSFSEFPKLRDGLIMVSDSDATLAAVRIMENQKLVKRISTPQIKCVVGEQATFCLASACDCESAAGETESLSVQVKAQDPIQSVNGSRVTIETGVQSTRGRQIRQLHLAYRIEEGQTAILKTRHDPRPGSTDEEHAVYVVVTPKIVK